MRSFAKSLVRYALTGGAAAVVDIGAFAFLSAASVPAIVAATLSFLTATVANYILTAWFVFSATPSARRYVTFLAGSLFALLINLSLTLTGVILFSIPRTTAKTVAVGMTFLLNFWINARLVFNRPIPQAPPPTTTHPSDPRSVTVPP